MVDNLIIEMRYWLLLTVMVPLGLLVADSGVAILGWLDGDIFGWVGFIVPCGIAVVYLWIAPAFVRRVLLGRFGAATRIPDSRVQKWRIIVLAQGVVAAVMQAEQIFIMIAHGESTLLATALAINFGLIVSICLLAMSRLNGASVSEPTQFEHSDER